MRSDLKPSETEVQLAELWSEVLQTDRPPGAEDDFFSLGGDSMSMVTLEFRIQEAFSTTLPPGILLRASTLRALAACIDAARDESNEAG